MDIFDILLPDTMNRIYSEITVTKDVIILRLINIEKQYKEFVKNPLLKKDEQVNMLRIIKFTIEDINGNKDHLHIPEPTVVCDYLLDLARVIVIANTQYDVLQGYQLIDSINTLLKYQ